jgi:hypothetical protein
MIRGLHVKQAHEFQVNLPVHNMFQDYLSREAYEHWGTCAQTTLVLGLQVTGIS